MIKKIVIDVVNNECIIYGYDDVKWKLTDFLGIRAIFKNRTYRKDFKAITDTLSDVLDEITPQNNESIEK